jgi:YidC/Oxa1 family membrane protein insertase
MFGDGFFHLLFTKPLYNGLIFLVDILPAADAGLAIIILTLAVKIILFPLSKKSIQAQVKMREIEPELREIKRLHKHDKQKQAEATIALYREKGINPFAGFILLAAQIPIIIALYRIFLHNGLPTIDLTVLYPFVPAPEQVSVVFLGLIDITKKSFFLACLAGLTQFFQTKFSIPAMPPKKNSSFEENLARSINIQLRYVLPVIAFLISLSISGAIALYWTTSNIFAIVQELLVRRKLLKNPGFAPAALLTKNDQRKN